MIPGAGNTGAYRSLQKKRRANDSALFAFCSLKGLFIPAQCSHGGVVAVINRIAQIREDVFLPFQEVRSAEPCRNGVMCDEITVNVQILYKDIQFLQHLLFRERVSNTVTEETGK